MLIQFKDLTELVIPTWVINQFGTNIETVDIHLQEEFIDLQNDIECSAVFPQIGYNAFWMRNEVSEQYPHIYQAIKLMFIAFPSSYLVEKGFSAVIILLTKQRNRLEISTKGDLRLLLTQLVQISLNWQRVINAKDHMFLHILRRQLQVDIVSLNNYRLISSYTLIITIN